MKILCKINLLFTLLITLLCLSVNLSYAQTPELNTEKIVDFNSKIIINSDNTLDVTETIQVNVLGEQIQHGIYRDFPTRYRYGKAFVTKRQFDLKEVLLDSKPIDHRTENVEGGTRVYIGDPDLTVPHGIHTYSISYTTNRQINFGSTTTTDQLNYNVTGNGWGFIIEKASADIYFPEPIDTNVIGTTAFIGPIGSTESNFTSRLRDDGNHGSFVHVEAGRRLAENEGLTVQIDFPKGLVDSPTKIDSFFWFIEDNFASLLSIIAAISVFVIYLSIWKKYGNDTELTGTIIPEYDAPDNLSAGAIRFLNRRGLFDNKIITALIAGLAIKKYIQVKSLTKHEYQIDLIKDSSIPVEGRLALLEDEKFVIDELFKTDTSSPRKSIKISTKYDPGIAAIVRSLQKHIRTDIIGKYYVTNTNRIIFPIVLSVLAIILAFIGDITGASNGVGYITIIIAAFLVFINVLFYFLVQTRTELGTQVQYKIEGLRLFISTVEDERYKSELHKEIPHTMDVYEKYLPYAIALDVEPIWTKRFKDVIDQANIDPTSNNMRTSGFIYSSAFADSGFTKSFTSTINSASVAPSSSGSGSSGGGSGGGGGGGGGGGW